MCEPLAGAPAIGDAVCFSIVSAGIVKTRKKVFKSKSSLEANVGRGNQRFETPTDVSKKFTLSHKTWNWGLKSHQSLGVLLSLSCHLPPRCDSASL